MLQGIAAPIRGTEMGRDLPCDAANACLASASSPLDGVMYIACFRCLPHDGIWTATQIPATTKGNKCQHFFRDRLDCETRAFLPLFAPHILEAGTCFGPHVGARRATLHWQRQYIPQGVKIAGARHEVDPGPIVSAGIQQVRHCIRETYRESKWTVEKKQTPHVAQAPARAADSRNRAPSPPFLLRIQLRSFQLCKH